MGEALVLPDYRSDLGRAIVRGLKDLEAHRRIACERAPRSEDGVPAARTFHFTPSDRDAARRGGLGMVGSVALVLAMTILLSVADPAREFWTWAVILCAPSLLLAVLSASLLPWLFPSSVVVGVDGVVVRGRYIPYARIRGVHHEQHLGFFPSGLDHDGRMIALHVWTVSLSLDEGEIELVSRISRADSDEAGAELAQAIEEALAAWVAGRDLGVDLVWRGERTGSQWLDALRKIGTCTTAAYRRATVDIERMARLLDDRRATPSTRAAAAVVLVASGDAHAAEKLRIAAGSMANPRLRVALESVAEGTTDLAVAEALEELEQADHEARV